MWFKYVVIVVFAVDALFAFMGWRGKKWKEETPTGLLMTGILYVGMIVGVLILIK
jgi:hypothetical protein